MGMGKWEWVGLGGFRWVCAVLGGFGCVLGIFGHFKIPIPVWEMAQMTPPGLSLRPCPKPPMRQPPAHETIIRPQLNRQTTASQALLRKVAGSILECPLGPSHPESRFWGDQKLWALWGLWVDIRLSDIRVWGED